MALTMLGRNGPTVGKWGRSINANDTNAALTVNQRGTGDILDIQDAGVTVFKIPDGGGAIYADDKLFRLGTDGDQVFLNRSTTLGADTILASVLVNTVESQAIAANTLMIANTTSNGDIALYTNKGGNSQMGIWLDGSAGDTALLAASGASIDHYIAGTKVLDHASGAFAFQESTTLSSTGTLTIGAITLGGAVNANGQTIGVIGSVQLGSWYHQDTTYDAIQMNMASGIEIRTRNVDNTAAVSRLIIGRGAAIVEATWANITHTGLVATSPTINGSVATTGLTLPSFSMAAGGGQTISGSAIIVDGASSLQFDSSRTRIGQPAGDQIGIYTDNGAGASALRLATSLAAVQGSALITCYEDFNLNTGQTLRVGGTQVVGARVIDARIDDVPNSGDATTDGIIAAIQTILQTHGLAAAA